MRKQPCLSIAPWTLWQLIGPRRFCLEVEKRYVQTRFSSARATAVLPHTMSGMEVSYHGKEWCDRLLLSESSRCAIMPNNSTRRSFVREYAENKQLKITQGDNEATFDLAGFEDAFGKHCS